MSYSPYTFTAKKNCILRVEGAYAFNFATNPNVYFTQDVDVTGVTLSQTEAAMTVGGETLTLTATVAPDNAANKTVTWTTSDANVATVADGVVTAVAAGTATITATATNGTDDTSDDFSATCEVSVAAPAAPSGPEVAWNKAENSGTFTMPGGNVTLEPEYYPQAALTAAPTAINDVPATTDGAIVEAGTVKNIGETTTAQGTVMYYVSPTELDDAALLALAADQWTADVPTAAGLAQGQAYVYYYVRGNDGDTDEENFSDGDILAANALTVTIAAEPTYAVTFADGVNPEPPAEPEWTASPAADVKKGQTVTVTYTGTKKVIGVKAEKKAAAAEEPVTLATPLTVEAVTDGTIRVYIDGTLEKGMKYSVNGGTKTTITETKDIEGLKAGDKVQFYGNGTQTQVYGDFPEVSIQGSGDGFKTKAYGNIMSLLDEEGFATKTDMPNTKYVFYGLFKDNSTLIDASELLLPATTLPEACYAQMFRSCTSLTTAPKLPATTLTTSCYYSMFSGCTSLTSAYVKAAYIEDNDECGSIFDDSTATGAVLHTAPGSKASWENVMGTDKYWENWSVADDWEE